MRLVELESIGARQWSELIAGEENPWGGVAEGFQWREKQRHVGIRDGHQRLVAVGGSVDAEVEVGAARLRVLGIGGVFVTPTARGQGLVAKLLDALLAPAGASSPRWAMLFCREQLAGMYAKRGFLTIDSPVRAQQPGGPIEMPLSAMWRPLRAGTRWPAGSVTVLGLPF